MFISSTHRNESYTVRQLNNKQNTSTEPKHRSVGPCFDTTVIKSGNIGTYDVIEHSQKNSSIPQAEPATPTPVRDESSKKGDDFYDAEQYTYASVDVQKKTYRQNYQQLDETNNVDPYDHEAINDTRKTATPKAKSAHPTLVTDESSKRRDDFYDAQQHTYSVVNVKHKKRVKKTSEDGEGEMEEPSVYTSAMAGDASQGMGEEGYSKLKH